MKNKLKELLLKSRRNLDVNEKKKLSLKKLRAKRKRDLLYKTT